jgi:hypothetical protein
VLGEFGAPSGTAFVFTDPVLCRSEIELKYIPEWWQQTWRQWIRQSWPKCDDSWQVLMHAPVWLPRCNKLRVTRPSATSTSITSYCLGMCLKSHRPFRRWFARLSQKSTLRDFVRADGSWPSEDQFTNEVNQLLSRHALGEIDMYVKFFPFRPKVLRLYSDLTSIVQQLVPRADLSTFDFSHSTLSTVPVPRVGLDIGTKTVYFPHIPPVGLREVTRSIPRSRKSHPVTTFIDSVPEHIAMEHLEFFFDCRRFMLPVVHDVMLRLLYRGLATRSKFWFLQSSDPDIVVVKHQGATVSRQKRTCCLHAIGCN